MRRKCWLLTISHVERHTESCSYFGCSIWNNESDRTPPPHSAAKSSLDRRNNPSSSTCARPWVSSRWGKPRTSHQSHLGSVPMRSLSHLIWLYTVPLPGDQASHPVSKGEPRGNSAGCLVFVILFYWSLPTARDQRLGWEQIKW